MLILLSPSKTLDEEKIEVNSEKTQPYFKREIMDLIDILKKKSPKEIGSLMGVSEKIASLNFNRYKNFSENFDHSNSKPALFLFKGDVYENMKVSKYSDSDLSFAQKHLLILSGLYGLIKPLDYIQPYRLEMGTSLKNKYGGNLYQFWGDKITHYLNSLEENDVIINLASNEYFKSVNTEILKGKTINVTFKNNKNGSLKVIGILAKKARGSMADYIIENKINNVDSIRSFNRLGYSFKSDLSTDKELVFTD